jgi:hypothetical protein
MTDENAPAVAEICPRLDGLPLAIELAAARMNVLTAQAALARLDRRLALLVGGPADSAERHRTLRGALDWSYELLPTARQRLFERLGIFAGGWSLPSAVEVCNPNGELGLDTLDGLSSLVDSSLIRADEQAGEPRFSMLQVIREFALERLEAGPDAALTRSRHAAEMLALAEEAGPILTSFEARHWQRRLRQEEENIRAALRWALDADAAEIGLRTASAMWRYWHYWSALREGRHWLEALLELPSAAGATRSRAGGLDALAGLLYWLGLVSDAERCYAEALAAYREVGDDQRVAEVIESSSWSAVAAGDYAVGLERARDALARFDALGDRAGVARVAAWLSTGPFLLGLGGSVEEALAASHAAIEESRRIGNAWDMGNWQGTVADIRRQMGDLDGAIEAFEIAIRTYADLGYVGMLPWLKLLASLEIERGHAERAVRLAAIAARAVEELGGELPEEMTHAGDPLADARRLLSEEAYERALAEAQEMTFEEAVAYALDTGKESSPVQSG